MYLVLDSQNPEIRELLGFSLIEPIQTVYLKLEQHGCLNMLKEPLLVTATGTISAENKTRFVIDREIKTKERAVELLARKYERGGLSYEDARNCILSIGDNNSYLLYNRDPVIKMIELLQAFFSPDNFDENTALSIVAGRHGHRLTHAHGTQYFYVLQSLTLWRYILEDMYRLWSLAENDLLDSSNKYSLSDTGQGLNRVQSAPRVSKAIHGILSRCQKTIGMGWVGSSVIHLGDRNVPNALNFIDKYNQVSRILQPIVICIRRIDDLYQKPDMKMYIDTVYSGREQCKTSILRDFFTSAFDGSGSDNFFEAGSCVDGRLTRYIKNVLLMYL